MLDVISTELSDEELVKAMKSLDSFITDLDGVFGGLNNKNFRKYLVIFHTGAIGILKKMDIDKATSLISSWKIDIERVE
jgi:hypothetical protein